MGTVHFAADLVQPHCYMTSVDVKNTYYLVKMSQKYLFYAGKISFELIVLPNGLSLSPQKFTKLT